MRIMKRASIQVGVNFLVVMIICIVLLGIGISLIGKFTVISEKMRLRVSEEHRRQLVLALDEGAQVAAFPTRVTTTKKGKVDFSIVISNELGQDESFSVNIVGYDANPVIPGDEEIKILYIAGPYNIPNNGREFVAIKIILPKSIVHGSYIFNVYVCNITDPSLCTRMNLPNYGYGEIQKLQVNVR